MCGRWSFQNLKTDLLLWHNWRGEAIGGPDKYSEDNAFIDGYLMQGPNHTFYVEFNRDESHEILYSLGFSFDATINLSKIPSNSCYSYVFNPTHDVLIPNALGIKEMLKTTNDPKKPIPIPEEIPVLGLYAKELKYVFVGAEDKKQRNLDAHKYHLLASRIFFEIFGIVLIWIC